MRVTLPGLTEFPDINLLFLSLYRDARDIFFDDVEIESVYGGFPGCALCGGRATLGDRLDLGRIRDLVSRYRDLGAACNATFSNSLINAKLLQSDEYGLAILAILDELSDDGSVSESLSGRSAALGGDRLRAEGGEGEAKGEGSGAERDGIARRVAANGAILAVDEVNEFVRCRFPELVRISSTTKGLRRPDDVNRELERYDRVVLDYNLTWDESVIGQIRGRDRIEVMLNEYCTPNCPHRAAHYRAASLSQLEGAPTTFACRQHAAPQTWGFLSGLLNGDVFLRNEDARRYEREFGIGSFKIVGRGLARYDVIDSYLYYLVKPEHWYEVRDYLVHRGYV